MAAFLGVLVLLCILETMSGVGGLLSRCTQQKADSLEFLCPRQTVLYQPIIFLGSTNQSDCVLQDYVCTGLTRELTIQKELCLWKRRCTVTWNTQLPLHTGNTDCDSRKPTVVAYDRPMCVKRKSVFNICTYTKDLSTLSAGVIRSHGGFPTSYQTLRGQMCTVLLRTNRLEGLKLTIDDVDLNHGDHLAIVHTNRIEKKGILKVESLQNRTLVINDGYVEISIFVSTNEIPSGRGFILRFERFNKYVSIGGHYDMKHWRRGKGKPSLAREGEVIETINEQRPKVMLSCPEDHVIHDLEVEGLESSKRKGHFYYRQNDCTGRYYSLITDNKCAWKKTCYLNKSPSFLFTSTNKLRCLSRTANQISIRNYKCVKGDSVIDMCSALKTIKESRGTIKSHSIYPWHYATKRIRCRKLIYVNPDVGLRLYSEFMDLDPDTRGDNLKIYHRLEGRKLVKKLVARQMVDVRFSSGVVELVFKVSALSKGGQGFIVKFEPLVGPGQTLAPKEYRPSLTTNRIQRCGLDGYNIRALLLKAGGRVVIPMCGHVPVSTVQPPKPPRSRRQRKRTRKPRRRIRWAATNDWWQK